MLPAGAGAGGIAPLGSIAGRDVTVAGMSQMTQ